MSQNPCPPSEESLVAREAKGLEERGWPSPRPHCEGEAVRQVFGDEGEVAALAREIEWGSTIPSILGRAY